MSGGTQATARLDEILSDLEQVLSDERRALTSLDASTVERCALRKEELSTALRALAGDLSSQQSERLRDVARALRMNQVLLVHARDHVRGVLGILAGSSIPAPQRDALGAEAARLDLRG